MEKYKILEVIGKGSFGEVYRAQNTETGEVVAIKTMKQKYATWDECMNLRELKSLRKLQNKNIVKLKEVLRVQNTLSFVFEHADQDIYKLYEEKKKQGSKLSEAQVKSIFYQLAQSLSYIHKHGYFHRDLKPENIMFCNKDGIVKLIDFGLAREIRSRPPYTEYVSTRWYRAPELLLRSTNYNSPVDVFALGCIMAELYMFKPLFNGTSELDQLQKVTSVLGTPSKIDWPEGYRLASLRGVQFPTYPPIPLNQVISDCPPDALQLIGECLKWDPSKRPTSSKILQHPYFRGIESVLPQGYFQDIDDHKPTQQTQNPIHNSNNENNHGNSNNDLNLSFGNEESSNKGVQQKKMSNQYSQSDVSIVNKPKQAEYKQIKALDLPSHYGDFTVNNGPDIGQASKPPLNPGRISRQAQRNHNNGIKSYENSNSITPQFNDRTKQKESGFNYSEFSALDDEDPKKNVKDTKPSQAPVIQNSYNFGSNPTNSNTNSNSNYQSSSSNNLYNFDNITSNNNNAYSGVPRERNSSQNPYPQSALNPSSQIPKPERNRLPLDYQTKNSNTNSGSQYGDINDRQYDNNDILNNFTNASNRSKHGYSSSQVNPRQQQQISSATDKRLPEMQYGQFNYTAQIKSGSFDQQFQPSQSLNPSGSNNLNSEFSLNQPNKGGYREFSSANQQSRNNNNMSPYKFQNNANYNYPPFSNVQQGMNGYAPGSSSINGNNNYGFPENYNHSGSGGAPNLASAQFGNKGMVMVPTNTTKNTNALANRNLYDFNNIRQPVRNIGLPMPFDKQNF